MPHSAQTIGIVILTVLAVVFTLYFGKELLLPITLALLFKLLLQAPMRLLTAACGCRSPSPRCCSSWRCSARSVWWR